MSRSLYIFFVASVSFAAGGNGEEAHHDSSIIDLFWPLVNVSILFGVIGWKVKNPLKKYFNENAAKIREVFDRAHVKSKEAKIKKKMLEDKLKNFSDQKNKILTDAKKQVEEYKKQEDGLTAKFIEKIREESVKKIEAEENEQYKVLNTEFVDRIIAKAKSKIGDSPDHQRKVSRNLLSRVGR